MLTCGNRVPFCSNKKKLMRTTHLGLAWSAAHFCFCSAHICSAHIYFPWSYKFFILPGARRASLSGPKPRTWAPGLLTAKKKYKNYSYIIIIIVIFLCYQKPFLLVPSYEKNKNNNKQNNKVQPRKTIITTNTRKTKITANKTTKFNQWVRKYQTNKQRSSAKMSLTKKKKYRRGPAQCWMNAWIFFWRSRAGAPLVPRASRSRLAASSCVDDLWIVFFFRDLNSRTRPVASSFVDDMWSAAGCR